VLMEQMEFDPGSLSTSVCKVLTLLPAGQRFVFERVRTRARKTRVRRPTATAGFIDLWIGLEAGGLRLVPGDHPPRCRRRSVADGFLIVY